MSPIDARTAANPEAGILQSPEAQAWWSRHGESRQTPYPQTQHTFYEEEMRKCQRMYWHLDAAPQDVLQSYNDGALERAKAREDTQGLTFDHEAHRKFMRSLG